MFPSPLFLGDSFRKSHGGLRRFLTENDSNNMESSFPFSSPTTVRWGYMMAREMAATTMAS
ncbi:hypothetical protein Lalb_Chr01g0011181 [Lupinus albus]|uniref:Uncharacterized protein n=1 Tax=Lupinus albus TaxID=3870 RepID=A0A6A4R2M6_LUPAL|nr:hypothetical protein Lalb_Chr01g0011181 [Lupinus albus]